ncbi:hypothetical protein ACFQV4_28260 [Streptomyces thermocarboxydus]
MNPNPSVRTDPHARCWRPTWSRKRRRRRNPATPRTVASHLSRLPGAYHVGRAAGTALDALGAISPRGRRIAVYTGAASSASLLVEWPVALTGAAVAWLTKPRTGEETGDGPR